MPTAPMEIPVNKRGKAGGGGGGVNVQWHMNMHV